MYIIAWSLKSTTTVSINIHSPPTFLLRPQQNSPRLSESHAATVDDDADRDESFRRTEMVNSIFELFPAPLFANSSAHPSIFHLRGRRWTAAEPEFMFREHFIHVFLFPLLPSTFSSCSTRSLGRFSRV